MATDSTIVPQTEASAGNDHQDFNPESVQLAQATTGGAEQPAAAGAAPQADIPGVPNGQVQVVFPEGQNIVRVQVAPGETISIPFDGDLAAKFGEEGNLAIKVGDRTIILQGYAEANQEAGVTLKDESGDDVDVASVVAATDPNLDIQTAAGGTAGGAAAGGSGFFSPFANAGGLGGLGELNVLGQTELQYGLIEADANILTTDTDPTLVSITFDFNGGVVNEDDLGGHHARGGEGQETARAVDLSLDGDLLSRLGQNLGDGTWQTGNRTGNDPFDTDDHENGSQTDLQDGVADGLGGHSDNAVDGKGKPIDQDREPTTAKATVTVDFHNDVPGKLTFSNGANVPVITQLQNQHLTSHGHELQYALLPAANGQGEMIVAYYTTENGVHHLVFTLGIEEGSGSASPSTFHVAFTSYDAIDNLGASADVLNIGVPFFLSDSDGSVVAVPAGPNGLNFQYVDDAPELGHVRYGEDGTPTHIVEANLTIGHDETAGNQHTKYQDSDGDQQKTDDTELSAQEVNSQVKHGLASNAEVASHINSEFFKDGDPSKGFKSNLIIGSAQMQLDVSFGADGKARGNEQAGKTIFAGDGDANAQAFEIYMQAPGATGAPDSGNKADAAQDHVRTNLTIDVNGEQVPVDAYQLDANTIIGVSTDGQPVFVIHVDPKTGEVTLTQYHQMHNLDGSDANDPVHLQDENGNPLVHFRATDFDGDHVDGQLDVSFIDDKPRVTGCDVDGNVAESALHDGNKDYPAQHNDTATGSLKGTVDFGADKDGTFSLNLNKNGELTKGALESLQAQGLTSHDHPLDYKMEDGKLVGYITDSHGNTHDVFTLEVKPDGTYTFTLENQLDHSGPGEDFENVDLSKIIKATDSDGDSVVLKDGQLVIHVKDDVPEATCVTIDATVDESALWDGNKEPWQHQTRFAHGSLAAAVSFGADNHGTFSLDLDQNGKLTTSALESLQDQGLKSHHEAVEYKVETHDDGSVTLTGYTDHHGNVFTLTIYSDGHYTFNLQGQLDHGQYGRVDDVVDIDFSGVIKATDEDGDSIILKDGQFEIHVKDDQPVATCVSVDDTVDESALWDGNEERYQHQTTKAEGNLSRTVDFGADNHGHFSIDKNVLSKLDHQGLQSHHQDLHYKVSDDGHTLIGYTGDADHPHVVFTLTVDSDGHYTFELKDQLDHKGPGNDNTIDIDFSGIIKATDEDGDSIHLNNGQFEIHVKDDQPISTICVANGGGVTIDESAGNQNDDRSGPVPSIFNHANLPHTAMGWAQSSHSVVNTSVSFGADDKGSESLSLKLPYDGVDSGIKTTDGDRIYLHQEGDLVVGRDSYGNAAFALSIGADGKLTVVQYEPIQQNNPNDPDDSVHIKDGALQAVYTVTDGDGDKDSHQVNIGGTVTFQDDGPSKFSIDFKNNDHTVDESALKNGHSDEVSFRIDYANNGGPGADGLKSVTFTLNNSNLETASGEHVYTKMVGDQLIGYTHDGSGDHIVFTISHNPDGSYTFDLEQPLRNSGSNDDQIKLDLTATVTDGDGDKQSTDFTIKVNDDTPGTPCVVSSDPNFVLGEGRIDEDYLPTGNHDADTNPDNVGVGGVIFPNSHYDDMGGTTVGGAVVVDYGADGPGGLNLTSLKVTSDAILGNTLLNVNIDPVTHAVTGTNNLKASDGTPIQLVFDGTTLTGYAGNQHDAAHAVFTFTLNANGTWSYTLLQSLDHPIDTSFSLGGVDTRPEDNLHFSFGVTATDKDGDAKTGFINVNVDDDGPQAGNFTLGSFQEHAATQDLGTVEHVFGGHYQVGADGLGNIQITGGNNANHGTLTIVNGHVYYTPPANVTGNQSYSFEYTVTDGDGDRSTATITVGVKDNVPTITHQDPYPNDPDNGNGELTLSESHLADGTQPDAGQLSKNGVFTIDTHGEGLGSIQINGITVTNGSQIPGDKGTLVIDHITKNPDGTYSVSYHYTVTDNHLLPNPNDTFNQQFNITVKDASGDSASSTITVHVTDDAPKAGAPVTMIVDEDGLDAAHGHNGSAGIEGGDGDTLDTPNHATVSLGTVFGADGKGSVAIDMSNLPQVKSDGHNVQYQLSADGHTLTGYITYESEGNTSRVDVLTLAIDGNDSEATFTLLAPIDHPDHGQTGSLEDNSTLNFGYTVTDGDGDKASGQIAVTVNDDTPTASCVTADVIKEPVDGGQTGHDTYTIDTAHYDAQSGNNTSGTLHISAGYVDANGNYVAALPGQDNDPASVNVNGNSGSAYGGTTGFGASSNIDGSGQDRFDEVNYLGDSHTLTSEALVISLAQAGKVATSATVNLAEFYPNEGNIGDEQGAYRLYLNGQPVSDWISFTAQNGNGSLGLTINGPASGFDKIVFAGLPATSNPMGDQNGSDSSDFSIHDATFNVVDAASIHGSVNSVHGNLPLQFGADGPGHVDLIAHAATGLTYNGQAITETVQNGVLYGKAGDTVIYTLSITHDQSGYHYQFDLAKPIDGVQTGHPITFDYSVTDNDGDKVGGCITVSIDDNNGVTVNLPTDAAGVTQVDEAGLAAGTHHGDGSNIANGHIAVNAPDGVTKITLGGIEIPTDGTVVHITDGTRGTLDAHWNATNHTIDYTYTLTGPTTEGGNDKATFSVVVTDPQGDHNTGQNLVISIHDDAPTAQNLALGSVQEGSAGVDGKVVFEAGADNLQSIAITKGNDGTQGTLTIDNQGNVHYTPPHNVDGNKSYTFEYTVTDKDGDHVTKTITVDVKDGVPTIIHDDPQTHQPAVGPGEVSVDESYIPGAGSNWQPGMTDTVHGTFKVDGGDENIIVTIDGHEIHLDGSSNAPITDKDGLGELHVTGVTKNADGSYTIDYDYTLEHAKHNDADSNAFDTSFKVTVTDQSGDSTNGDLTVHVIDDKPTATMVPTATEHLSIDETKGASTGSVSGVFNGVRDAGDALGWVTDQYIGVLGGLKPGADGLGDFHHALKIPAQGTDSGLTTTDGHKIFLYQNPDGVVVGRVADDAGNPNPNGEAAFAISITTKANTLSVVQYEPLHHNDGTNPDDGVQLATGSLNVVLVVTDSDGDQGVSNAVDISHNITFKDDGPTAQDLSNTTPVHEGDASQVIGKVTFDAGTDGLQSIVVSSGNGQGHGTLSIDPNGTVHYTAPANVTGNQDYTFEYTVTDKDGDHVTKTITVHVGDNVPTISHDPGSNGGVLTLSESHLADGTQPDASQLNKAGAFTIDTHGEGLGSIQINGNAVTTGSQVQGDKGVLVIDSITNNGNGTYSVAYHYTVTDNHELPNPNDTFNQDFNITVKDASGDTANSTITVHVTDDAPTAQHADLGSFDENSGEHIGHVDFKAGADGLQSVTVTAGNDGSQGTLSIDADGKVHYTAPTDVDGAHDYTFTYKVTDKDGDTATNTITVHVNDTAKPVLIVGANVDDNPGQQKDHYIDHAPSDQNQGSINGGDAGDVLVGDVGGKSGQIAAGDYNICLILDISTSMNDTFAGSGGKSRLDVMQAAVDELLAKYANHPGDVNIKIIAFGTDVYGQWTSDANGDFTSTTSSGGKTAIQFVDGLDNRGTQYTNYEAAMAAAKAWFDQVGNNGNTNKAYFLSDGDPTARLNNSGQPTDIDASPSNSQIQQYISEALGAAGSMLSTGNDGLHVDFQAIGIGSGVTKANLDKFDNSGDTTTPGNAQIVNTASDLNDALDVGKAPEPFAQGDDVINGGKGNDLIFGDEVYTESLNGGQNDGNPNTIGWQNFGNMTEAQIVAWLKANPDEAGKEYANTQYGNDTLMGGEGDDVIYGQGGDDIITGGKNADQLHGGSGNDTYIWAFGDGNDTIMETAGLKDTLKITGTDTLPTLTKNGNDLLVTIGGETITVKGQFETDGDNNPDTNKAVEYIEVNGQTYRVDLDQNGQPKLTVLAPPVNTVPSSIVATGTTTVGGVSVADIDSQILTVTLAVDHGAITLASMAGLTFDAGDGTNDSTMTFHGTQGAINAALAGLKYTSDGNDATLTMTSKDGEGHTDTDQISIHALNADLNLSMDHGNYGSTSYTGGGDYDASGNSGRHIVDQTHHGNIFNGHYSDDGTSVTIDAGNGNDWIEGGDGNDILKGNGGNDYLDGGAGHDRYSGGDGNDVLLVDKDDFTGASRLIDGGSGDDVLDLSGVGNWDFRGNNYGNTGHQGITNIETLNLNHNGAQTVTLDANSVLDMTDSRHTLVIQGNSNDHLNLDGSWNQVGTVTDHGTTYNVFQSGSGSNLATVVVEEHIVTTHG